MTWTSEKEPFLRRQINSTPPNLKERPYRDSSPQSEKSFDISSAFKNDIFDDDTIIITQIANGEDPDPLPATPRKQLAAQLMCLTGLIAPVLSFYTSRIQFNTLKHWGVTRELSNTRLHLALALVIIDVFMNGMTPST